MKINNRRKPDSRFAKALGWIVCPPAFLGAVGLVPVAVTLRNPFLGFGAFALMGISAFGILTLVMTRKQIRRR